MCVCLCVCVHVPLCDDDCMCASDRARELLSPGAWQRRAAGCGGHLHTACPSLQRQQQSYVARRAVLYCPGDDRRKLAKLATLDVDCAVLDCEDGVALGRKVLQNKRNRIEPTKIYLNCLIHIDTHRCRDVLGRLSGSVATRRGHTAVEAYRINFLFFFNFLPHPPFFSFLFFHGQVLGLNH